MTLISTCNDIEPECVTIPAGEFLMGCESGMTDERPVHRVVVGSFDLAIFAVTNQLYSHFIDETGKTSPSGWSDARFNGPNQPVTSVSWFDAVEYCEWLSRKTDRPYRLPTEAEWERAARGDSGRSLYTWGDDPPENQPGYFDSWRNGPEPVGKRSPNGFGLFDMSENVHEWCSDWYDQHYYGKSPIENPLGPAIGTRRSSRGGSWRHQIKITRVAARNSLIPNYSYSDYGLRVARDLI